MFNGTQSVYFFDLPEHQLISIYFRKCIRLQNSARNTVLELLI